VVSQADVFHRILLRVEKPRQELQVHALFLPQELPELQAEVSNVIFVGVVDCLAGQDGSHTCYADPVLGFLRLWPSQWTME
jgi:hypothetical protein